MNFRKLSELVMKKMAVGKEKNSRFSRKQLGRNHMDALQHVPKIQWKDTRLAVQNKIWTEMRHLIEKEVVKTSSIDRKDKFLAMAYDKCLQNEDGMGGQWWLNER